MPKPSLRLTSVILPKSLCALVLCLSLVGCGDGDVQQVTETRTVEPAEAPASTAQSSAERFGAAHGGGMPPIQGHPKTYTWEAPEGWREAESTMMRKANFVVGSEGEAECYLTVLSGDGGGIPLNVNRWRGQMGLEALTEEQIAALPTIPMVDTQAVFIEAGGTFGAMGDDVHVTSAEQKKDYVLQGAICLIEDQALFVKMTGPAATVNAEKDHFLAFCRSIRPSTP